MKLTELTAAVKIDHLDSKITPDSKIIWKFPNPDSNEHDQCPMKTAIFNVFHAILFKKDFKNHN